ncbi:hypothetical protein, partial [Bacillus velezensis]|uniref:hypothetical protein n=1 Tax=Bacillus velezensis TaxID=492670 RepID=UPI001C92C806
MGKVAGWGMGKGIRFGSEEEIIGENEIWFLNDWIMIRGFFIRGLYFVGFFVEGRKDKDLLFFWVMCVVFCGIIV